MRRGLWAFYVIWHEVWPFIIKLYMEPLQAKIETEKSTKGVWQAIGSVTECVLVCFCLLCREVALLALDSDKDKDRTLCSAHREPCSVRRLGHSEQ